MENVKKQKSNNNLKNIKSHLKEINSDVCLDKIIKQKTRKIIKIYYKIR